MTPSSSTLSRLLEYLSKQSFTFQKQKCLLSVSGGLDSMVLLECFFRWKESLGWQECQVITFDHQQRKESLAESLFVEKQAHLRNMKCPRFSLEIPEGASFQQNAREIRRNCLKKICNQENLDWIVLAHHQDDQVETLLMRILRGTSMQGLCGIHFQQDSFLHPFLLFGKTELKELAQEWNLEWKEDPSNQKNLYTRNKIRLKLLPEIQKEYQPQIENALLNLREEAQEIESFLFQKMQKLLQPPFSIFFREVILLHTETWSQEPSILQKRALQFLLKHRLKVPLEQKHLATLLASFGKKGKERRYTLHQDLYLLQTHSFFCLLPSHHQETYFPQQKSLSFELQEGSYQLPWGELIFQKEELSCLSKPHERKVWIDKSSKDCFFIRNRCKEDPIHPAKKSQTSKEWFVEQNIPACFRDSLFFLVSKEKEMLWGIELNCLQKEDLRVPKEGYSLLFVPNARYPLLEMLCKKRKKKRCNQNKNDSSS